MEKNKIESNNTWWDYCAYFVLIMLLITSFGASKGRQETIIKQNERIIQQNDSIKKELIEISKVIFD